MAGQSTIITITRRQTTTLESLDPFCATRSAALQQSTLGAFGEHRPALMAGKAVAVDFDKIDIGGPFGNAFGKDRPPFIRHRADKSRGDFIRR